MLLDNKNAIIYRAGGSIGGAVAKECARGGASVFLTGRNRENLETVAKEITAAGGAAEVVHCEPDTGGGRDGDARRERRDAGGRRRRRCTGRAHKPSRSRRSV